MADDPEEFAELHTATAYVTVLLFDGGLEAALREVDNEVLATQMRSLRLLSQIRGSSEVVEALTKMAQLFDSIKFVSGTAMAALGAVGAEQSLDYLRYQSEDKGRPEARAALSLFGKATFDEIRVAELCPKCRNYSRMKLERSWLGDKKRCANCHETHSV